MQLSPEKNKVFKKALESYYVHRVAMFIGLQRGKNGEAALSQRLAIAAAVAAFAIYVGLSART